MKSKLFGIILLAVMITGCATYNMAPQTLKKILEKGNPQVGVTQLNVVDKDGKSVVLTPTIHTAVRITKNDDTRQQLYFITLSLKDSVITGSKSVIFNFPIKPIKVSEIKKVELDGR
ncbi:MAG TPA: hypothetical protein DIW31_03755 [Bacteroidales bacterium]|nr:hypothetical protein [Bacteroidales bacterium]